MSRWMESEALRAGFDVTLKCIFCDIVASRAQATILREWPSAIAIRPLNPVVEGHVLVIPKKHVQSYLSEPAVTAETAKAAAEFTRSMNDEPIDGFNLITSEGAAATQTVPHLHFHIVPRYHGDGLALPWTNQTVSDDG